ncbi:MAG: hypothetical protein A2Y80_04105 [Deltaproteobacteria bacterium RBG_13_58_19]|nr:MAG: hypothetical protein A2Y80_04105 [Deltaproteobacteria bacterium RBG_13_58_19]
MSADEDQEDRERPSWREIDQRRDRQGQQRAPAKPRMPKKQAELERQLALRQAEALFRGKRGRPEYQKALKELEAAHGTKKFSAAVKKFLEEYGLPEEWGALNLLLDFPQPEVVGEVLAAMAAQMGSRSRVEQQGFKGRVRILALTSKDGEVRRAAEEILAAF